MRISKWLATGKQKKAPFQECFREAKNKMTQHEEGQSGEHQRECPQSSILSETSQKSRGEVQAQIPCHLSGCKILFTM